MIREKSENCFPIKNAKRDIHDLKIVRIARNLYGNSKWHLLLYIISFDEERNFMVKVKVEEIKENYVSNKSFS